MRTTIPFAAFLMVSLALQPVCAFCRADKIPDQQSIEALEAKANQAKPRDQCFLYAEVVQEMTELSVSQYSSGNVSVANRLLKDIQRVMKKVHLSLAKNAKHLKKAQILLSKTSFRLTQMLHASSYEDQPLVKATLAEVNQAQRETMLQVFQK